MKRAAQSSSAQTISVSDQDMQSINNFIMPRLYTQTISGQLYGLFQGIVFRADNRAPDIVFYTGFNQTGEQAVDLDVLSGKKFQGHTLSHGISTSKSFQYAKGWSGANGYIYMIDLLEHPFAVDIDYHRRLSGKNVPAASVSAMKIQQEVNVANSIDRHLIVGCYTESGITASQFHMNPDYMGNDSVINYLRSKAQ